ncbi:hypothetical protein [Pleomorphomonas oryzae]|uniref:hypothetical protein n=1 Tax=Pleomorphomonas oryzae TaxID=261934 RepID=UPI001FDEFDE1|nr:hypothetical protein [Pleomorphomonas oryzae]
MADGRLAKAKPVGNNGRPLMAKQFIENQQQGEIEAPDLSLIDIHYERISV